MPSSTGLNLLGFFIVHLSYSRQYDNLSGFGPSVTGDIPAILDKGSKWMSTCQVMFASAARSCQVRNPTYVAGAASDREGRFPVTGYGNRNL